MQDDIFNLYVVTHKMFNCPSVDGYFPIAVGSAANIANCPYMTDASGLNISDKNKNYCELTAFYWIWKNAAPVKFVGLCHYRRFFSFSHVLMDSHHYLDQSHAVKILQKYDLILPERIYWPNHTVMEQYHAVGIGHLEDLQTTRDVISEIEPGYLEAYDRVMASHSAYYYNMLVTRQELFNEYASWLFRILFEVEKRVDISSYDNQEARIFGYISERLLNVWVLKHQLSVKELPVVNTGLSTAMNLKERLRNYKKKSLLRSEKV